MSHPYAKMSDNAVAMSCSFCLCFFFVCTIIIKVTTITDTIEGLNPSMERVLKVQEGFITFLMIGTLVLALVICMVVLVMTMTQSAREAVKALMAAQKEEEARGRMSLPPVCDWQLAKGHKYCTFLSHFKVEAGSDARYLSDLIRRMTGAPAYLDSTDLVDLRLLFQDGVHKTDAFVILATKGVLTRPWCIMEMWEAARHQIPIVLFPVIGGGFDMADAKYLLSNLEAEMEGRNQYCMPEVMAHLRKQGVTDVRELEDVLLTHIGITDDLDRPGRPGAPGYERKSSRSGAQGSKQLGSAARLALRGFGKGGSKGMANMAGALKRQGTSSSNSRLAALVAKASGPPSPKPPSLPTAGAHSSSKLVALAAKAAAPPPAAGATAASSTSLLLEVAPSPPPSPPWRKSKPHRESLPPKKVKISRAQRLGRLVHKAHDAEERLAHKMHDAAENVAHGVENAAHKAHDAEERLAHKMHDAAENVAHGVENAAHKAHDAEERLAHKMHDAAENVAHGVENAAHKMHDAAEHLAHDLHLGHASSRAILIDDSKKHPGQVYPHP